MLRPSERFSVPQSGAPQPALSEVERVSILRCGIAGCPRSLAFGDRGSRQFRHDASAHTSRRFHPPKTQTARHRAPSGQRNFPNNADPGIFLTTQIGERSNARVGRLSHFKSSPIFNARVSGNDRWGYDHSNKCQGNQKVVHLLSLGAAPKCSACSARSVSITGSRGPANQGQRHESLQLLMNVSTVCNDPLPEPRVEIARTTGSPNRGVIAASPVGVRIWLPVRCNQ
jgi:hypothetical protein